MMPVVNTWLDVPTIHAVYLHTQLATIYCKYKWKIQGDFLWQGHIICGHYIYYGGPFLTTKIALDDSADQL